MDALVFVSCSTQRYDIDLINLIKWGVLSLDVIWGIDVSFGIREKVCW